MTGYQIAFLAMVPTAMLTFLSVIAWVTYTTSKRR